MPSYYSHSQLTKLASCPRAYKFQYEDRVKTRLEPQFFVVGTCVENAINAYLLARDDGKDIGVEGLLGVFDRTWELEVLKRASSKKKIDWKDADPDEIRKTIRGLVETFPARGAPYIKRVYLTQARLALDAPLGLSRDFLGFADFIADVYLPRDCERCKGDGSVQVPQKKDPKKTKSAPCDSCAASGMKPTQVAVLAVIDLKTASQKWSKLQATADSQATEYVWTVQRMPPLVAGTKTLPAPTHAGYLVGVKSKAAIWQFHLREPSPFDFMEVESALKAHETLIRSGERPRNPGYAGRNCDWCDFRSLCWEPGKAGETLILKS